MIISGVSSIQITNSIFDRNSSANDIFVFESGNITINNSLVRGGFDGSGENIIDADPLFVD